MPQGVQKITSGHESLTDGRTDRHTDGRTEGQTDRQTDGRTDERKDTRTHARTHFLCKLIVTQNINTHLCKTNLLLFILFFVKTQAQPPSKCEGDVRVLLPEWSRERNIVFNPNFFNADSVFYVIFTNPDTEEHCTTRSLNMCVVDLSKEMYHVTVRGTRHTGLSKTVDIYNYAEGCRTGTARTLHKPGTHASIYLYIMYFKAQKSYTCALHNLCFFIQFFCKETFTYNAETKTKIIAVLLFLNGHCLSLCRFITTMKDIVKEPFIILLLFKSPLLNHN